MATVKVKFRHSSVTGKEGTIYYLIIHERKVRQLLSGYKAFPSEWDESASMLTMARAGSRKSLILSIRERIRWDVELLKRIDRKLCRKGLPYSVDDVIDEFNHYSHGYSLFNVSST